MDEESKKLVRDLVEAINGLNRTIIAKQFYQPIQQGGYCGGGTVLPLFPKPPFEATCGGQG